MKSSRTFLVVYLPDTWQPYFDVMRILCNPLTQSPAHITVRGPYVTKPRFDPAKDGTSTANIHVKVLGAGTFFRSQQNTVFFRCESQEIDAMWWKRDYNQGEPHLTIYDGGSRSFAKAVKRVLDKHEWNFSFVADKLHEYVSAGRQIRLDLKWTEYASVLKASTGTLFARQDVEQFNAEARLALLNEVATTFIETELRVADVSPKRRRAVRAS